MDVNCRKTTADKLIKLSGDCGFDASAAGFYDVEEQRTRYVYRNYLFLRQQHHLLVVYDDTYEVSEIFKISLNPVLFSLQMILSYRKYLLFFPESNFHAGNEF